MIDRKITFFQAEKYDQENQKNTNETQKIPGNTEKAENELEMKPPFIISC